MILKGHIAGGLRPTSTSDNRESWVQTRRRRPLRSIPLDYRVERLVPIAVQWAGKSIPGAEQDCGRVKRLIVSHSLEHNFPSRIAHHYQRSGWYDEDPNRIRDYDRLPIFQVGHNIQWIRDFISTFAILWMEIIFQTEFPSSQDSRDVSQMLPSLDLALSVVRGEVGFKSTAMWPSRIIILSGLVLTSG